VTSLPSVLAMTGWRLCPTWRRSWPVSACGGCGGATP